MSRTFAFCIVTVLATTVFCPSTECAEVLDQQVDLPTTTNRIGMELKLLPADRFERGAASIESFGRDHAAYNVKDAVPQHQVILTKPFYLSTTEVTRGQFARFVEDTSFETTSQMRSSTSEKDARGTPSGIVGWDPAPDPNAPDHEQSFRQKRDLNWTNPGFEQTDDHPVVGVSFSDAKAFCRWLSKKENQSYRLPTEAEWEYAARAGTQTLFSFGNEFRGVIQNHANVANSELEKVAPGRVMRQWIIDLDADQDDGHVFTSPVGHYMANPFGLHDMHGNVWEWCEDKYLDTFYDQFKTTGHQAVRNRAIDPVNLQNWTQQGDWRVIRGGSWFTSPIQVRSACRGYFDASDAAAYVGFRVAMDAPASAVAAARQSFQSSEAARAALPELTRELRERRKGKLTIVVDDRHLTNDFFSAIGDLDEPIDIEVNARGNLTGQHIQKLTRAKHLTGLILSGTGNGITDADLAPLADKPEIQLLQITGTVGLSDKMMTCLSGMNQLRSINLHGDGITDAGLKHLPELAEIESLHVPGTQATGAVLKKVASQRLTDFQCRHFTDDDFLLLRSSAKTLKSLHLSGPITDAGLQQIVHFKQLRLLSLSDCPHLTDDGLAIIGKLPRIETLRLQGTNAGDLTINAVASNNWLSEIRIGSESLTNHGIMQLSEMTGLRRVEIDGPDSSITDAGFAYFWRLQNLYAFVLVAPGITGEAIEPLTECPDLNQVTLAGKSVSDAGLGWLAKLDQVRSINVGDRSDALMPKVTALGIQQLAALPKGVRVRLHRANLVLTDSELKSFRSTATHLEVSGF
ncbi:SUMF1/EgtB/PvdO family nonheme iron enzyme [Stieleria marina]|uniref:Serine/threonine-protein kinase pkn1 n=1 Tax=Stieleria marina TaxID=1930275 RepID=A0A517NYG0_9BACT|nr:Serine/threonine-protein kinase pkn1 [Planctomycetes bacterium K23_9]